MRLFSSIALSGVFALVMSPDLTAGWCGGGGGVSARGGANGASGSARHGATSSQSFAVKWAAPTLELYNNVDPNDFFSSLPSDYRASGQPLLVFLTTASADQARQSRNAEETVLRDEPVALGSRLFRAVRLDGDRVSRGHPQWNVLSGTALPRVVVVDSNGRKDGSLEGNDLTASNVFKLMKRSAAKTYKADLEQVVKQFHDVLDDLDAIDAKLARLAEQKKTAPVAKQKQIAVEEQELAKQLLAARVREETLTKKFKEDRKVAKS